MRQHVWFDARGSASAQLTTLCYEYSDGYRVPEHFHDTDQVVFASRGVMTVRTKQGIWVVPPRRAVWIPSRTTHSITMSGPVSMRTLYFAPKFVRKLPRHCCVINVSSLLRELILHACQAKTWTRKIPVQRNLIGILTEQLEANETDWAHCHHVRIYLTEPRRDYREFARVWREYFPDPARAPALAFVPSTGIMFHGPVIEIDPSGVMR